MLLRVHFFGQPRFSVDGEPFTLSAPPKALLLLAFLMLNRTAAISRDTLAFTLWADDDETTARSNLRRYLYRLQHALPHGDVPWLVLGGDTVQWNGRAPAWFDVAEFERVLASDERVEQLTHLYTGDLLEGLYEDWIFRPRERLRAQYVSALEKLVDEARSRRDFRLASHYIGLVLGVDPWREDAVRTLMGVRYAMGDRSGALQIANEFIARLSSELDAAPMPETLALRESILRDAPVAETPAQAVPSEAARMRLPFAGRDFELRRLSHRWNAAARGRGRAVLIGGEPGIGKSRLVQEFALIAEGQGALVFVGGTSSPEHRPYQAITESLAVAAPLLARSRVEPQRIAALAEAVPALQLSANYPVLEPLAEERYRVRLFEAFAAALEGLTARRPTVFMFEDLHWAGPASIAAFEFLARRVAAWPVLLIGTYRTTAQTQALRGARESLRHSFDIDEVILGRLSREAVADIAHRLSCDGDATDTAERLYERSEGYPVFLDAIVYCRDAAGGATASSVGLKAIVSERLQTLPAEARELAEIASIFGDGFTVDQLCEVADADEDEVLDALSTLQDQRLVRERRRYVDFVFSHHLVQQAIYSGAASSARKRRHRRVADILQRVDGGAGRVRQIAWHYERAGDPRRAADFYVRAAEAAAAVYALEDALETADLALALTDSNDVRSRSLLVHERAAALLGLRNAQRVDIEELTALANELDDSTLRITVAQRKIEWARGVSDMAAWAASLGELAVVTERSPDALGRARLRVREAEHSTYIGKYEAAREALRAALDMLSQADDIAQQLDCYCALVRLAVQSDDVAELFRRLEEVNGRAGEAPPHLRARALGAISAVAFAAQDYERALLSRQESLVLLRAMHDRCGEAYAHNDVGTFEAILGRYAEAHRSFEISKTMAREIGDDFLRAICLLGLAGVFYIPLGMFDDALSAITAADGGAAAHARSASFKLFNLSEAAYGAGDFRVARDAAHQALTCGPTRPTKLVACRANLRLGEAELCLGNTAASVGALEAAVHLARELRLPAELADVLSSYAGACRRSGDLQTAKLAIDESLAIDAPYDTIHRFESILWTGACVFHDVGDRESARRLRCRAQALVEERSAAIPEERWRAAYRAISYNREILSRTGDGLAQFV